MTLVVLLILAALWAAVLVPPLLRARTGHGGDSIGDFEHRLGVLGRTNGSGPSEPRSAALSTPRSAARRRRDVLRTLGGAVVVTALLAVASGTTAFLALHVLADALLVVYLGLWAWVRSTQIERAETVRYLPQPQAPELALRRTATS